jgi:hypothetical protein
VVQDGSLRTAKKFNHKLRDKYILQIRVFDNGTPPLFSDTYGTKRRTSVYFLCWKIFVTLKVQCCESGMFIPDPNFSIPDPGSKKDSGSRIRILIKEFKYFQPQNPLLSSRMFTPDPDFCRTLLL